MSQLNEFFKPEALFSRDNPFLKSVEKSHRLVFEALDKTARLQLELAEDLLDMNRSRFDSLYKHESFTDVLADQQNLAAELGERAKRYAEDLQEVFGEVQAEVTEAANEFAAEAKPRKSAPKSKKAA